MDAPVEGGTLAHVIGGSDAAILGGDNFARRAWARRLVMIAGQTFDLSLAVPATGDFDLYLYSLAPDVYGTPVLLASSTNAGLGVSEAIQYTPASNGDALLVVKKVSGQGQFTLSSNFLSYGLALSVSGTGSGTVTSSPAGIQCLPDCVQDFASGTIVTLNAAPDAGSVFTGWGGDADCSDGIVTMNSSRNCTATFSLQNFTLNINRTGNGTGTVTSSPLGIDCGVDCQQAYVYGTIVTMTPSADAESLFDGWSGDPDCLDGVVTMNAAKTCTASFVLRQYQIVTALDNLSAGIVNPDCTAGCLFDSGTLAAFTLTANNGYVFNAWTNCDSAVGNVCTETVDMDKTITATFQPCLMPVRIDGTTPAYFNTLQAAYDAASDGGVIQIRDVLFTDNLDTNRAISVTLDGGYNCDYSGKSVKTGFNGIMSILNGQVEIGGFVFGQ